MTTTTVMPHEKSLENNTTMATWAGAIARALAVVDIEAADLFAQAGIDFDVVNRPDKRIPVTNMTNLWDMAVRESGNPAFGLSVAQQVNLTTFHALGVAAMASDTVVDAAETVSRFASMVSDGIDMQIQIDDQGAGLVLAMKPGYPRFADACVEAVLAAIVMTARQLVQDLSLITVSFQHECGGDANLYRELFDCPVQFNAPRDALFGAKALIDEGSKLPGSSPSVAQANLALCEEYLSEQKLDDVSTRVKKLIALQLDQEQVPSLMKVASELAMSERKLQRQLREEGMQFRDLLDMVRAKKASDFLLAGDLSVSLVAEKLAFESVSAFSRAFRRWHGMTPRQWRQENSEQRIH